MKNSQKFAAGSLSVSALLLLASSALAGGPQPDRNNLDDLQATIDHACRSGDSEWRTRNDEMWDTHCQWALGNAVRLLGERGHAPTRENITEVLNQMSSSNGLTQHQRAVSDSVSEAISQQKIDIGDLTSTARVSDVGNGNGNNGGNGAEVISDNSSENRVEEIDLSSATELGDIDFGEVTPLLSVCIGGSPLELGYDEVSSSQSAWGAQGVIDGNGGGFNTASSSSSRTASEDTLTQRDNAVGQWVSASSGYTALLTAATNGSMEVEEVEAAATLVAAGNCNQPDQIAAPAAASAAASASSSSSSTPIRGLDLHDPDGAAEDTEEGTETPEADAAEAATAPGATAEAEASASGNEADASADAE